MTSRFEDELGEELYAAAVRHQERRRRRAVRIAAASAAAVVAGGVAVAWPSAAAADVEVRTDGGVVEVHIGDGGASPDDVLEALEDEGFDASVTGLSTGPSGVGHFVRATVRGGEAQPTVEDQVGVSFRTFTLPEGWTGELVIGVGIAGAEDLPYESFSDPFAPGEPLHCAGVLGEPLSDVADELTGLTVSVRAFEGQLLIAELPLAEALATERADWIVSSGSAISVDAVALTVAQQSDVSESGCR